MTDLIRRVSNATIDRHGAIQRRDFLRTIGVGAAGLSMLGWQDLLLAAAPTLRQQGKSVIVLWMQGGPSHLETFDPKPKAEGEAKSIGTAVPGIEIAEYWPQVAKQMKDITLIRSMSNKEGNHQRATYQLHTGYIPGGTVRHPSFGSLVTKELAPADFDLPGYVSIGGPARGAGFLPVEYNPFQLGNPAKMPDNVDTIVPKQRFQRRLGLLNQLEGSSTKGGDDAMVSDHRTLYSKASTFSTSPKLGVFDIKDEPAALRQAYGDNRFGQGCLLARRLVETGTTYVEVTLGGWDTHFNHFEQVSNLAEQCDPAFATLIADLKQRGMLDDTLVVWMGEFGRTPKLNGRGGRDHFPRAFNVALAGCGIEGGQVIGKTSDDASEVIEEPVSVVDLFATLCTRLGIDPHKENMSPLGRPMKIVDGGTPIESLLS
ncbi:hypothetical protein Pan216_47170 [Planctomycetes bacterium Pan216]|uniref:DUF1501 domain-containing protein n=1 Tax=Kolteria novifilia TaxID=2527975 RepID=A0A518BA21_9BACT|nr:hypothetical protein Pan216_47170 [Planctomycetes bacterium Pan216]